MNRTPHRTPQAFSLVEVTLALGIAVFCLVVVFGLLTVGINTSSLSVEQTNASNLLAAVASDLRTAPNTFPKGSVAATTYVYQLSVPAAGTTASTSPTTLYLDLDGRYISSTISTNPQFDIRSRYQLNVWFTPGTGRNATLARVVLSWPASVSLANASGTVETMVALDRN